MGTSSLATSSTPLRPPHTGQVEELQHLQKAAQNISSILDLDPLIDKIVNEVARWFGCVEANVYLHDEDHSEMVLAGVHGCTIYGKGKRLKIGKEGMVGYVASTGQMRYAPDVRKDEYYIGCEESTLSEVAIPLHSGGRLVGVFTVSHPELDAFPPEQLRLLQAFCAQVSAAVHNARRFQRERDARESMNREAEEARIIQQALLPKSSPYIPGFAISGVSVPARAVGGDWYDFIPFDDGCLGLVLADVSGKGAAAALLMSATRGILRSLAETCSSPADVLNRLNRVVTNDFPAGRFVTMVYGVLDPAAHILTFANAGHLKPLLVDEEGAHFLETERGMPVGLGFGDYSDTQVKLSPGARLVFYSDGITEAENDDGEEYSAERLAAHALSPVASALSIVDDVRTFANSTGLHDDATVVFLGVGR